MQFVPLSEIKDQDQDFQFVPLKFEPIEPAAPILSPEEQVMGAIGAPGEPKQPSAPRQPSAVPELRPYEPTIWERFLSLLPGDRAKAANEYTARQIAKEKNISVDEAYRQMKEALGVRGVMGGRPSGQPMFNPEGRAPIKAVTEAAPYVFEGILDIPKGMAESALRAYRAGDIENAVESGMLGKMITYLGDESKDIFIPNVPERLGLDKKDPNYQGFMGLGKSLGYSLTTMVASATAGTATTLATGQPLAGVAAGMGTSGTLAYRASKDDFLDRLREKLNKDSQKVFNRPLSNEEWAKAKKEFNSAAVEYGAWEAIPEAISNAIFLKAFAAPAKTAKGAKLAGYLDKAASFAVENLTETATGMGQNAAELKAGLTQDEITVADAFKQQFIQTLLTMGVTAGGMKGKDLATRFYNEQVLPRVDPASALAKAIKADIESVGYTPAAFRMKSVEEAQSQPEYTFTPVAPVPPTAEEPPEAPAAVAPVTERAEPTLTAEPVAIGPEPAGRVEPRLEGAAPQRIVRPEDLAEDAIPGMPTAEMVEEPAAEATVTPVTPAAPSLAEQSLAKDEEVSQKDRWIKNILGENRLYGETGVRLSVTPEGQLNFLGDPEATRDGRRLLAALGEAKKAGATNEEIAAAIRAAEQPKPEISAPTPAAAALPDTPAAAPAIEVKLPDPPPANLEVQGLPIQEVPLADLKLSKDVPQFKLGASDKGVVEPLGGKFERTGVAPIQVWRRMDGTLEIISGRHRFDLAQRSGEPTIPAQIHDEAQGFGKVQAAILDAELNIRDGQGKVKDYVNYFKESGIDREAADARGLLARATGKRSFTIANEGSDELVAAVRGDQIGDEAAYYIALNAPGDSRLQGVGIKAIQDGKSANTATNMMQAVKALAGEQDTTTDMFGFDDSAIKEAEAMAKIASQKQREIQTRLNAISGAAKNPAVAKAEGIDIRDPQAVQRRIGELRQMKAAWDNWSTNPQLVAEIRAERGVPAPELAPVEEPVAVAEQPAGPSLFEEPAGIGAAVMGQRQVNAADRFRDAVVEQFGLSPDQADRAMGRLLKEKVLSLDPVMGQFNLKDGRLWDREVMLRAAGQEAADTTDTPAEEAAQIKDKTIREKLMEVANNLGVRVFETSDRPVAGDGYVQIPPEDKLVEGSQSAEQVFAHELGHAIMQKRGMAFNQMSHEQVAKWIKGWPQIREISKAFRPEVYKSKMPKTRRHANKPDEIIADALGSFLLGQSTREQIKPLLDGIGLSDYDLGLKPSVRREMEDKALAEIEAKNLLKAQTEEELRQKAEREAAEAKRQQEEQRAAEQKAKADEQVGDFVLTGSDRAADEAAARGQQDIFAAPQEPTREELFAPVRNLAEKLLDKGTVRYEDTEFEGKIYQARTRMFEGKLFGSELRTVQEALGDAREVTLINQDDRVMTFQFTGKFVGEGRNVRIMDTQYVPTEEATAAPGNQPDENDPGFIGASDKEVADVARAFDRAKEVQEDEGITRVFDAPKKADVVRMEDKARVYVADAGYLTVEQAKQRIEEWKKHAEAQGDNRANSEKIVLSLFDMTGEWSKPWEEAGYQVYRFDIQTDPEMGDVNKFSAEFFNDLYGAFEGQDVYAILAACPCTDFASSGARHFAAKDADGRTVESVELVQQTLRTVEYFKPSVWAIENPVGRIEKLTGLPPWRLSFNPNHFGDPYTKKTLLWGRFNADLPMAPVEPTEGSKMHRMYGGKSQATKNARSVTPEGFAYAFFMANNAIDNPVMALANKYDMMDRAVFKAALDAGLSEKQITEIVDDPYYFSQDYNQAEADLRAAIETAAAPAPTVEDTTQRTIGMTKEEYRKDVSTLGVSNHPALKIEPAGMTPKDLLAKHGEKNVRFLARLHGIDVKDKNSVARKLIELYDNIETMTAYDKDILSGMTLANLKPLADEIGVSNQGQKWQIVDRLANYTKDVEAKFAGRLQDLKHKAAVTNAVRQGMEVKDEVLRDYPELTLYARERGSDMYKSAARQMALRMTSNLVGMEWGAEAQRLRDSLDTIEDPIERQVTEDVANAIDEYRESIFEKRGEVAAKLATAKAPTMQEMAAENKRIQEALEEQRRLQEEGKGRMSLENIELREEQIKEYAKLRSKLARVPGKVAKGEASLDMQETVARMMQQARDLQFSIRASKPRRDSAEKFLAKALTEFDNGNISADVLNVIQTAYQKNPELLEGLLLSVKTPGEGKGGTAGEFIPWTRIVRLYKGTSGVDDPVTIRHELTHTLEQMMTPEQRMAVVQAWGKALARAIKQNPDELHQKYFNAVLDFLDKPSERTYALARRALPSYEMYQFINPSEFWAVNGEKLMASELGSAWAKFKRAVRKLWEGMKKVLGFDNRYDIHKVFNQVMGGSKERMGEDMLVDMVKRAGTDYVTLENIEDEKKLMEKYSRPHTPQLDTTPIKTFITRQFKNGKEFFQDAAENPREAMVGAGDSVMDGLIYLRNKNVWYGSGLEARDFDRYNGELKTAEGFATASVALDNAIRSGNIGVEVIFRGGIKYDPKAGNFVAVERKQGMKGVYEAEAALKKKLGNQLGTDIIQGYLEAKRSISIMNELYEREANYESAKETLKALQQMNADPDDIAIAKAQAEELQADLDAIKKAASSVNMSEEEMYEFAALDKKHTELRDIMDNWTAVNQNLLRMWRQVGLLSQGRYDTLSKIEDYVPWYRIMADEEDVHSPLQATTRSLTNIGREKLFKRGKPISVVDFRAKEGQKDFKIQPSSVVKVEVNGKPVAEDLVSVTPSGEVRIDMDLKDNDLVVFNTNREIENIIDNMTRNVMRMTMNGIRQYAANRIVMEYASRNEKGKIATFPGVDKEKGRFNWMVNGKKVVVEIQDPLVAASIYGMENLNLQMWAPLAAVANLTRRSITLSGVFQLKQVFKDAPTAALVTGVKNPMALIGGVWKGFITSLTMTDPAVDILKAAGIGGFHSPARTPEADIKRRLGIMNRNVFSAVIQGLDHIGDASDMAQRVAVYKRVMAETGDETQALYQAANVINFLHHGSAGYAQAAVKVVPFLGAYANSMDVLIRALMGGGLKGMSRKKALARLSITMSMLVSLTLLYAMLAGADPEYDELDDQTKLKNIIIPGTKIMLPMNTSAAYFFKAIPELIYNKVTREGTENEYDRRRLRKALGDAARDMLIGPEPIPAGVKPLFEVAINHDFFTGRPVIPEGLKDVEAAEQYTASTSELGKKISAMLEIPGTDGKRVISPIEADHIVRGVFGTSGAMAQWVSNSIGAVAESRPEPTARETPVTGSFLRDEVPRGREDLFYDFKEAVNEKYQTWKKMMDRGDDAAADAYLDKHGDIVGMYEYINEAEAELKEINSEIRRLGETREKDMTPRERRLEIEDYKRLKSEILDPVKELRREVLK